MKTLLITLEYPPFHGGVAHYYGHLVASYPEAIEVLDNSQQQLVKPGLSWLPAVFNLARQLRRNRYDYVLVGHVLPLGTAAWLCSYVFRFRYAVFLHGYDLTCALRQPRKAWLTKKILARAAKIIGANSYTVEQVKTLIDQKQLGKVKLLNPGIVARPAYDEQALQQLQRQHGLFDKTVLFSLGRLVKRKGFDQVIKALPAASQAVSNLVYYLAGDGPDLEYLHKLVADLPAADQGRVQFLGEISEADKWSWLDACQIFIMPARDIDGDIEGFGIVYLEAGLAGKPVIAGQSGGVSDAVVDDQTGLVVDGQDPAEIAQAIVKLAPYEGLRQRLGDQGRQRAWQKFAWSKQAAKLYEYLH